MTKGLQVHVLQAEETESVSQTPKRQRHEWTVEEDRLFLLGLRQAELQNGQVDFSRLAELLPGRTRSQIRTHYRYLAKAIRENNRGGSPGKTLRRIKKRGRPPRRMESSYIAPALQELQELITEIEARKKAHSQKISRSDLERLQLLNTASPASTPSGLSSLPYLQSAPSVQQKEQCLKLGFPLHQFSAPPNWISHSTARELPQKVSNCSTQPSQPAQSSQALMTRILPPPRPCPQKRNQMNSIYPNPVLPVQPLKELMRQYQEENRDFSSLIWTSLFASNTQPRCSNGHSCGNVAENSLTLHPS